VHGERRKQLAGDVWAYVWAQLYAESGWTSINAGRVATDVRRAFEAAVRVLGSPPNCGTELFCEFCGSGPECIVCGRGRP
jgi:hypothetical protein